jgi:hypothetical protein
MGEGQYGISLANNTNVSVNNDTLILHDIQGGVIFTRIQ